MSKSKLKIYLLFALIGIITAVILLIIREGKLRVEPPRVLPRQTQRPVRATVTDTRIATLPSMTFTPVALLTDQPTRISDATPIPILINPPLVTLPSTTFTPVALPTDQPTRISDATPISAPIPILINPPYAP